MPTHQTSVVIAASRLFTLLAISAQVVGAPHSDALPAIAGLGIMWLYQVLAQAVGRPRLALGPTTEAAAVGALCALGMESSPAVLAALLVPPLCATMSHGLQAMARTALVEVVTVVALGALWWHTITPDQGVAIFTWVAAGIGLSLVAGATVAGEPGLPDPLRPYRDAQHLIRQLIGLSGNLSSGLDTGALGGGLLADLGDLVPTRARFLYVPRGEDLTPVAASPSATPEDSAACEELARQARLLSRTVISPAGFAFPIGDHAVLAALLTEDTEIGQDQNSLDKVRAGLAPAAVRLDTALLFTQFRDAATADERKRLAREMHDGVAQDIASIGYIVDALAARPADDTQATQLNALRDRVTKVVAEVRQSVTNLRTSIGENESLGAAISGVARHLSEASGIAIQVRLDEQPARLRPEVEAELFRITQEAINNAVKHSRANRIDVLCHVSPPHARITVTDDGVGLQTGRTDSHGLTIMRERAKLIGADLSVRDNASRGLTVSVTLRPQPVTAG
ncbi:sensor histidine kinase [Nocardioides sp. GY 10113]|uniref:sensor histidine kinase n=1 Tax=Nocardioides sp. GY 10113 TaxID=2569761 RepID=UPI0010A7894D|nr:sensor histidine kinase [Nocardioides sp. GY 10113]TIC88687.1 sensor histidine kinase [Nocardioides sp. GY 10113]